MPEQDEHANEETTPLRPADAAFASLKGSSQGVSSSSSLRQRNVGKSSRRRFLKPRKSVVAGDSYGWHGHAKKKKKNVNFQSLTYQADESDVWRAHWAVEHYVMRGRFWNHGKFKTIQTYFWIVMTGILQAVIAYSTNLSSKVFIDVSRTSRSESRKFRIHSLMTTVV